MAVTLWHNQTLVEQGHLCDSVKVGRLKSGDPKQGYQCDFLICRLMCIGSCFFSSACSTSSPTISDSLSCATGVWSSSKFSGVSSLIVGNEASLFVGSTVNGDSTSAESSTLSCFSSVDTDTPVRGNPWWGMISTTQNDSNVPKHHAERKGWDWMREYTLIVFLCASTACREDGIEAATGQMQSVGGQNNQQGSLPPQQGMPTQPDGMPPEQGSPPSQGSITPPAQQQNPNGLHNGVVQETKTDNPIASTTTTTNMENSNDATQQTKVRQEIKTETKTSNNAQNEVQSISNASALPNKSVPTIWCQWSPTQDRPGIYTITVDIENIDENPQKL